MVASVIRISRVVAWASIALPLIAVWTIVAF